MNNRENRSGFIEARVGLSKTRSKFAGDKKKKNRLITSIIRYHSLSSVYSRAANVPKRFDNDEELFLSRELQLTSVRSVRLDFINIYWNNIILSRPVIISVTTAVTAGPVQALSTVTARGFAPWCSELCEKERWMMMMMKRCESCAAPIFVYGGLDVLGFFFRFYIFVSLYVRRAVAPVMDNGDSDEFVRPSTTQQPPFDRLIER